MGFGLDIISCMETAIEKAVKRYDVITAKLDEFHELEDYAIADKFHTQAYRAQTVLTQLLSLYYKSRAEDVKTAPAPPSVMIVHGIPDNMEY